MMFVRYLVLSIILVYGTFFQVQLAFSVDDFYHVTEVEIDSRDADLVSAKKQGVATAKQTGLRALLIRMTQDGANLPLPTLAEIETMVSESQIRDETFGGDRYLAKFSVRFNPASVRRYLNRLNVAYFESKAPAVRIIPQKRILGVDLPITTQGAVYSAWQDYIDLASQGFELVPLKLITLNGIQNLSQDSPLQDNQTNYFVQMQFFALEDQWAQADTVQMTIKIQPEIDQALQVVTMPPKSQNFTLLVEGGNIDWQPAFDWVRAQIDDQWRRTLLSQVGDLNQMTRLPLAMISADHATTIAIRKALSEIRSLEKMQIEQISPLRMLLQVSYRGSADNFRLQLAARGLHIRPTVSELEASLIDGRKIIEYIQ